MKPPFTYFGGKLHLAARIAASLPPHEHYVEPFAGSLAVLLAKPQSRMETVNDLDGKLMNFWRVLRDYPADLERVCALTPHSRAEYRTAYEPSSDELEQARRTWVILTQGRGGQMRSTGWRFHQDPGGSASMPAYLGTYVDRILPAARRLRNVSLECMDALKLPVTTADIRMFSSTLTRPTWAVCGRRTRDAAAGRIIFMNYAAMRSTGTC